MKPESSFLRGAAVLTAGACGAKLLGALFKIPLARLLGPQGAGHFSVAWNIYLLVLNGAAAGIPLALSCTVSGAAGDRKRAAELVRTGLFLFGGTGILWGGALFLFARPLAGWMRDPGAAWGIRAAAPAVVFTCLGAAFRGYFQGKQQMGPTAAAQCIEALGKLVLGLGAAVLALRAGWDMPRAAGNAMLGAAAGAGLGAGYLLLRYRADPAGPGRPGFRWVRPILGLAVPVMLGNVGVQAVNALAGRIVLGRLQDALGFNAAGASTFYGIYTMAQALSQLPPALVQPLSVSMVPAVSESLARGRDREAVRRERTALALCAALAAAAGAGLWALSEPVQRILYGYDAGTLTVAGPVLAVLGPASGLSCMTAVTNAILQARGRARWVVRATALGGAVQLAVTYVLCGDPRFGILGAALGALAGGAAALGCNGLLIYDLIQEKKK